MEAEARAAGSRWRRAARALLYAVPLIVAFSYGFVPLRVSHDEWWHLKAGKWIVENGRLPVHDIFTYPGENLVWHNHEWLAQVAMYAIYAGGESAGWGGWRTIILVKSLVFLATVGLVMATARARGASPGAAALGGLLAADLARRTLFPRPPFLSYFLFALVLCLLTLHKTGRLTGRWLAAIVVLMVIWCNLHGMALLAIAAAGAFAGGAALEALAAWWRSGGARTASGLWHTARSHAVPGLALLTAAVVLAGMANPSGWEMYFLSRKFTADPLLRQVIAEMLPPPFVIGVLPDGAWYWNPVYQTFWIVLALMAALLIWHRGRLPWGADYILIAFFAWQALNHLRLLPLFGVAAMPVFAVLLTRLAGRGADTASADAKTARRADVQSRVWGTAAVMLGAVFVFAIGEPPPQTFARRNLELARGKVTNPVDHPENLMRFIIDAELPGRMFSQSNYCGYAIWWLSPEHHKLFTDNRFDLFGSEFLPLELIVVDALAREDTPWGQSWEDVLAEYGVNFVVMSMPAKVNRALWLSEEWVPVFYDVPPGHLAAAGFLVWVRRTAEEGAAAARALRKFQEMFPGRTPAEGFLKGQFGARAKPRPSDV